MADASGTDWAAYCLSMATATYDLAEQTDEPEIIEAYLAIASKWLRRARQPEPSPDL